MNDITKIQLIHDIKSTFELTHEDTQKFIDQIERSDFKENIERFFRGYKIEDLYGSLQGALPWVRLVHGLEQNQFPPRSKEEFQVPDYLCFFESSTKDDIVVLAETKSVSGDKKTLELMKKQVDAITKYSSSCEKPILIAIFWEKYGIWTHVPIDIFEEKKSKFKITIETAIKSDVSTIFGDVTFLVTKPIYRKTTYEESIELAPSHEEFGSVLSDSISSNGVDYFSVNPIESAILDALISMKTISKETVGKSIVVTEKSSDNYMIRLSNWMLRHIAVFGMEPNSENLEVSRKFIIETMKNLGVTTSYAIPSIICDASRKLFEKAFTGTSIWNSFVDAHP